MDIKPNLQFSVLCDDVRLEENGKFMLIGLFESISSKKFPATHPTLYVVNRWCKGAGTFKQKIRILESMDQKVVFQTDDQAFELRDIDSHHTLISRFNNLVFEKPGKYWAEVMLDGELVLNYPIILREITNEQNKPNV